MGFFSRLAGTAITLSLAAGAYQYLKQRHVGLAAFWAGTAFQKAVRFRRRER
jgi:hypothetical protein